MKRLNMIGGAVVMFSAIIMIIFPFTSTFKGWKATALGPTILFSYSWEAKAIFILGICLLLLVPLALLIERNVFPIQSELPFNLVAFWVAVPIMLCLIFGFMLSSELSTVAEDIRMQVAPYSYDSPYLADASNLSPGTGVYMIIIFSFVALFGALLSLLGLANRERVVYALPVGAIPTSSQMAVKSFCPYCGKGNQSVNSFCIRCGRELNI